MWKYTYRKHVLKCKAEHNIITCYCYRNRTVSLAITIFLHSTFCVLGTQYTICHWRSEWINDYTQTQYPVRFILFKTGISIHQLYWRKIQKVDSSGSEILCEGSICHYSRGSPDQSLVNLHGLPHTFHSVCKTSWF